MILKQGAVQPQMPVMFEHLDHGKGAQVAQRLPHRLELQALHIVGVLGIRPNAQAISRGAKHFDPVADKVAVAQPRRVGIGGDFRIGAHAAALPMAEHHEVRNL